jgi:cephalosporin-C deacetylase-like acetyl esterase
VGKELPTVHHWRQAAIFQPISSEIVLLSNFAGKGPAAPGTFQGASFFGSYDMAGNVKEWCWNASGDKRSILGGAWAEPNYMFLESDARSPFERGDTFGFRCALYTRAVPENVKAPLTRQIRDYSVEKPAPDEQFRVYKSLYSYDRTPLEEKIEATDDNDPFWRVEMITFNAAYGDERVIAYLYLPKKATPPYETVVHFPAAYALFLDKIDAVGLHWIRYFVQSGRALLYPIYKGTYERRPKAPPSGPLARRDQLIQRCKDLGRSIDYLESRPDIDRSKLAYHGISMGAVDALPCLAVEDRFQTAILQFGGLPGGSRAPETDPFNFAPRIRIPVLMINGRNDFLLPLNELQLPLFRLLGSAPADKRHFVVEGGHTPPRNLMVKDALDWLDRYLGPVSGAP